VFGNLTVGPGGVQNLNWQINNANGIAGPFPDGNNQVSGWSLLGAEYIIEPGPGGNEGNLVWTATSAAGHQFNMSLQTLINPITVGQDTQGSMAYFDPTVAYVWPFLAWRANGIGQGTYFGPMTDAALNASVQFDTTNFVNDFPAGSTFSLHLDLPNKTIDLVYTPVPEPGTFVLVTVAGIGLFRVVRRTRRG
jgi:hypothetical protein